MRHCVCSSDAEMNREAQRACGVVRQLHHCAAMDIAPCLWRCDRHTLAARLRGDVAVVSAGPARKQRKYSKSCGMCSEYADLGRSVSGDFRAAQPETIALA